jgi:hypothetical protein
LGSLGTFRLYKLPKFFVCTSPFCVEVLPVSLSIYCLTILSNSLCTLALSGSPSIYKNLELKVPKLIIENFLTIVKRPPTSNVLKRGKVFSLNSSNRRRKAETESSNRPLPNWSFEQSSKIMGGFWLYCGRKVELKFNKLLGKKRVSTKNLFFEVLNLIYVAGISVDNYALFTL